MKIIYKISIIFFLIIFFIFSYLTLIGLETDRFNNQITKKLKDINPSLELELKEIKIKFDLFELKFNAKTIGTKLIYRNKSIEIENIKTQIPLSSLFNEKFLIRNLEISSKPLKIKDLVSFVRVFNNNAKFYILEKIIKEGFIIADIKLDFDEEGNIKNNFKINGLIKEAKVEILKKYEIDKINLLFKYEQNSLNLLDTNIFLNNINFTSKSLNFEKKNDYFEVSGEIEGKNLNLEKKNIDLFLTPLFPHLDIDRLELSIKNNFLFNLNDKFQIKDLDLDSEVKIKEFLLLNNLNVKKIFPNINKEIKFYNHNLKIKYKNKDLIVNGKGDILLQKNFDNLIYSINSKNNGYQFKTIFKINQNPFILDFLNYEKSQKNQMVLSLDGSKKFDKKIKINSVSLEENDNKFLIKDLELNQKYIITNLKNLKFDYFDRDNQKNKFSVTLKDKKFFLTGPTFNANNLIENCIDNESNKLNIFNKKLNLVIKIDELFLDKENTLNNLEGNLILNNDEIIDGNLIGYFSNNEKLNFTKKSNNGEKITTLFIDKAEPIVRRYKFIKGFENGKLDFYSLKKNNESISKIKIFDFKLKELPALTKLLTLASLQGIADLLSGDGIGFDEFEMNFRNKDNTMTIDEIYAIGPAISILMNGYVEKNKLISLRGTLVPATTINKVIGSIPVLGQILVGSKTGEGVFGVSFKIKGPPKKLETTVNPIKTLTPRFITRTLEKIKKN